MTFDQRRRVIIRRRPLDQPQQQDTLAQSPAVQAPPSGLQERQPVGEFPQVQPVPEQPRQGSVGPEVEELVRRAEEGARRAKARFEELLARMEEIKTLDKSIQRVFVEKYPTPNLAVVKRKLSELEAERSRVLATAGDVEAVIQQAVNEIDSVISELEQVLFDKSVDLEYLYEAKAGGKPESQAKIAELEAECSRIRDEIARIMSARGELLQRLELLKNLPNLIYKLTTYADLAPEYLKRLKESKPLDESKLQHAIARVVQDEQVPREYAILYLYKKLMSQKQA